MKNEHSEEVKRLLWDDFATTHKIADQCVPLLNEAATQQNNPHSLFSLSVEA